MVRWCSSTYSTMIVSHGTFLIQFLAPSRRSPFSNPPPPPRGTHSPTATLPLSAPSQRLGGGTTEYLVHEATAKSTQHKSHVGRRARCATSSPGLLLLLHTSLPSRPPALLALFLVHQTHLVPPACPYTSLTSPWGGLSAANCLTLPVSSALSAPLCSILASTL